MTPDRTALGLPLPDEIRRQRLIDLLSRRWNVAAVLIEAPGGYGKSTAIAQAMNDNDAQPSGYDAYVACRAIHRDPATLATAILDALGVESGSKGGTPGAHVEAVVAELSRFSPNAVCLHLDDLHTVADADGAVGFVSDLLRQLPRNAHLVAVGRWLPKLPITRLLAADQAVLIAAKDLVFTEIEVAELADNNATEAVAFATFGGWPAMTRLALVVGEGATEEFLIEEVIGRLTSSDRLALAAVALGGQVDASLMSALDIQVELSVLAARVPLMESLGAGRFRAHDLWVETVDRLLAVDEKSKLVEGIALWHSTQGRHDDAISTAVAGRDWVSARQAIMAGLRDGDVGMDAEMSRRWHASFPEEQHGEPELRLLRGMGARLENGAGHGVDDVAFAFEAFEARNDVHSAATAGFERGFQLWLENDIGAMIDLLGRATTLIEAGATELLAVTRLGEAGLAEMNGDFEAALRAADRVDYAALPTAFAELTARHAATMAFLTGDSARGVREVERVFALDPSPRNEFVLAIARFEDGDPTDVLESWSSSRYPTVGNRRDDFWMAVFSCVVDASLGNVPQAHLVRDLAWDRSREQSFASIVTAAALVISGDETEAATELDDLVTRLSLKDRMMEGELRRFLPYGYVLSEVIRDHFDDLQLSPALGIQHQRHLALARALLAMRHERDVDWGAYDTPQATLCALPLPWSVEFACGLIARDESTGLVLAEFLSTVAPHTHDLLRRVTLGNNMTLAAGARTILGSLAAPPSEVTQLRLSGDVAIDHSGIPTAVGRNRVRQLLALLALRGSVSREEVATLLWPKMDIVKARNNLRITLAYLRQDLEPDRLRDEPSYHLRQSRDRILLHRSPHLRVDVWEIEEHLDDYVSLGFQGNHQASITAAQRALALWEGPVFEDIRDVDGVGDEITTFDRRLSRAGVDGARWLLAEGRTTDAVALAERLVGLEPSSEMARGVLIAAHLDRDDLALAGAAIEACTQMLDGFGLDPSRTTRMLNRRYELRLDQLDNAAR